MSRLRLVLRKLHFALGCVLACMIMTSGEVRAQTCNVSIEPMVFKTVTRTSLDSNDTTATLVASCTGLAGDVVRLCPTVSAADAANVQSGAYKLRLTLYADPSHTLPLHYGIDIPLGTNGSGSASQTIYGRLSQTSAAFKGGQYTAVLNLGLIGSYLSAGALCNTAGGTTRMPYVQRTPASAVASRR